MQTLRTYIVVILALCTIGTVQAQLNTDRITSIGRNALYFEDYVLSIQYFNQVIKLKPYLAEPYQLRAIAKIQLSDYQGALRDCNAAIERNPFQPGAYYTRGYVYRQLGEPEKAEKDFTEALIFSPENKTYMLLRADTRAQLGQYDEARADIDYLLRREPESASLHFERGVICMQQNDTSCALTEFKSTVQYDSQNAQNWSALGVVTMMTGDEDAAFAHITQAINLGSTYAGDFINRGIIYYRKHNYRAAMTDYDKAIELSPRESQCYFNRGVLRQEVGDYNRAYNDLSKALELIELYPSSTSSSDLVGPILYQRGMVSMQLQQWKDAITDFDSLSALHPTFLPAYYIASRAHVALGEKKQAQACLQKAYQIEQEHNSAKDTVSTNPKVLNTDVQMAKTEQGRRDYRKLFSQRAAQNGEADNQEQKYQSASRGRVQDQYQDLINEPNISLTYYAQSADKYNFTLDAFNRLHLLPGTLKATTHEMPLSAEMVSHHFAQISNLSTTIDALPQDLRSVPEREATRVAMLLFSRAVEFAVVQDYASAIEDCSRALTLSGLSNDMIAIMYFCQANWRYRSLETDITNYEIINRDQRHSEYANMQAGRFTMMVMDYDQVLRRLPDFAFAYYNKANILCRQKDYAAALLHYDKAIQTDSEFAEAYFNRGLTYIYIGKQQEGLQDLSRAGELGIYQAYNIITRLQ